MWIMQKASTKKGGVDDFTGCSSRTRMAQEIHCGSVQSGLELLDKNDHESFFSELKVVPTSLK
jgi:hypothetical protein